MEFINFIQYDIILLEFDKQELFAVITTIGYCKFIIYEVKNTAGIIDIIIMLPAAT
ncbi:hypothetical protein bsdcttw_37690 [Anaerocolumna chitinilytica]|uniref:Uncharacterized protein n=1 Tax=Anaerocolumna chitinilytica TaxID=1727145 RepID=A0A7I8DQN5_9FIRM|nr:hypothetical protein bsdcttw_37690 [Anaerocolumna chitinilytica]